MQTSTCRPKDQLSDGFVSQSGTVITIHTDASIFGRLRSEWDSLRKRDSDQNPFLTCDWFACWWRAFGGGRTLFLVTVRRGRHLRAILPLMLERSWQYGIPLRRLSAIGNDHTPCFDLIRDGDDEELHRAVWDHLMTLQSKWDVLDLPRLNAGSISTDSFVRLATEQGVQYNLWEQAPRSPWIDIQQCWDDYLDSRSAGFRKTLRRKMRRLSAAGKVGLETVTGPEALAQALADGLHIEADGWKSAHRTAILSQNSVSDFYTELAHIMAARGQLRLHFLTLDDVRIAFDYSIIANRCLYSLKAGHRSKHARFSPGALLLGLILAGAHEEGLIGMDLLGDSDEFKMQWTDSTRTHQWLHCYSESMRGRWWKTVKCRVYPTLRAARSVIETAPP